jgi:RHS repeat-associated protein
VLPGTNTIPFVSAGPDQTAARPGVAILHTEVLDDGLDFGVNHFYEYNALNWLTNLNVSAGLTPIANYAYTLAPSGHRTAATEVFQSTPLATPTTLTRLYNYDRTYRLTNETIGGTSYSTAATLDYSYDRVGNRLQLASTEPGVTSALYTYDSNDRLNTTSAEQFDANGNTLFASGFAMTQADRYDFENRLVQRVDSWKTVTVVYDGDGNRAKKIVTTSTNTVTTWFLVDTVNLTGYAQVLDEVTTDTGNAQLSTPKVTRTYSYGHDLISQQQIIGNSWVLSFYGYDGHGNTRFLTDVNANVTDTYDYDAFGNLIDRTGSTANNYLFTGEQYDPDLALYFLRARYHSAYNARFWTMDDYEGDNNEPDTLHKYSYCSNEPVNRIDPSGNWNTSLTWATVGAVMIAAILSYRHYFVIDRSESQLRNIGPIYVLAEVRKQDNIISNLERAVEDADRNQFRSLAKYGLRNGGNYGVTLINYADPYGQQIRNIWEQPTTMAGAQTARLEASARALAGRNRGGRDCDQCIRAFCRRVCLPRTC